MQESLICGHGAFLPAMWSERQERWVGRLAVSTMEGAGGRAMAGREIGEDRREESWRVMVLRQPRAESGYGDGLGGGVGGQRLPRPGRFQRQP